jgi:hypothetical protein
MKPLNAGWVHLIILRACLAENPGALKIMGLYPRNARRMTSYRPLGVTGNL